MLSTSNFIVGCANLALAAINFGLYIFGTHEVFSLAVGCICLMVGLICLAVSQTTR